MPDDEPPSDNASKASHEFVEDVEPSYESVEDGEPLPGLGIETNSHRGRIPRIFNLSGVSVGGNLSFADSDDNRQDTRELVDRALRAASLVDRAAAFTTTHGRGVEINADKSLVNDKLLNTLKERTQQLTEVKSSEELLGATVSLLSGLKTFLGRLVYPDLAPRQELGKLQAATADLLDDLTRIRLDNTLAQAEQALGPSGTAGMASHFYDRAKREERAANLLRVIVVLLLLGIAGGAAGIAFSFSDKSSVSVEVSKLAIAIPLLGLAYYLSKEASQHRDAAQRAREIEVRLRTVIAYTAELDEHDRLTIRADLGKLVFAALPSALSPNTVGLEPAAFTSIVSDAVKAALERTKETPGITGAG